MNYSKFNIIKMLQRWLKDLVFVRLLKNSAILLSGNIISSILALISFVITARVLGPEYFGVLVIIQTYTRIVDRLINFQSWQALIKYGSGLIEKKSFDGLKSLLKFGFLLDLSTAVLGMFVAILCAHFLSSWQGWDIETTRLTRIYSLVILANLSGTPTAILRLFDRFKLISIQEIITSATKLILVIFAFILGADFLVYFLIWMVTDALRYLILLYFGFQELKQNNIHNIFHSSIKGVARQCGGIYRFILSTNLISSVRMISRDLDIILIGGLLGEATAGSFKVAKQFANILIKLLDPFFYAIYPELTKLLAKSQVNAFRKLITRTAFFTGGMAILWWFGFFFLGKPILVLTFGKQYAEVFPILMLYMIALIIAMIEIPFTPALLAMGKDKTVLYSVMISTLVYCICLPLLISHFALTGAACAYIIFYTIHFLIMLQKLSFYIKGQISAN